MRHSIAIIGAGIAGLSAAQVLQSANIIPIIIDKGRQVGGRVATRRVAEARFDHGAQFFTARSIEFQQLVAQALDVGVIKEWQGVFGDSSHPRYCGLRGISDFPKYLAKDHDMRLSTKVIAIEKGEDYLFLELQNGEKLCTNSLIVTAPLPQSLSLISENLFENKLKFQELYDIEYYKSITLLVSDSKALTLPGSYGGLKNPCASVKWIGDNAHKGNPSAPCALTIQCSYNFSERYFEAGQDEVFKIISKELKNIIELPAKPQILQIQKWRYAEPRSILASEFQVVSQNPYIAIAGEAFSGPKIEGAYLSGVAVAKNYLLNMGRE